MGSRGPQCSRRYRPRPWVRRVGGGVRSAGPRTGTEASRGGGQEPPSNGRVQEEEEWREVRRRRRSRRGQENRPRSGEEAETKYPTAAPRRGSARPRSARPPWSAPGDTGPAERVGGAAAARRGSRRAKRARTAARGQGARVGAAPPVRPGLADSAPAPPALTWAGPAAQTAAKQQAPGSVVPSGHGRLGAAEVAAAPRTLGAGPGQPSCSCPAGRCRPVPLLLLLCRAGNS